MGNHVETIKFCHRVNLLKIKQSGFEIMCDYLFLSIKVKNISRYPIEPKNNIFFFKQCSLQENSSLTTNFSDQKLLVNDQFRYQFTK